MKAQSRPRPVTDTPPKSEAQSAPNGSAGLPGPAPLTRVMKTLRYRADETHFLRRLGSAVVLHWDSLSDEFQDLLIDQASIVQDESEERHATQDIESFIRKVKAVSIKAPPSE